MTTVSIPLVNNKGFALVDEEDYPLVADSSWFLMPSHDGILHAARSGINRKGTKGVQFLHNVIMQPPDDMFVDHRDGDGLNCTRGNMRYCTFAQNMANRRQHRHSTSPYKGVHWHKGEGKWHARVLHDGKRHYLGAFDTAEDAARAYDRAAILTFGEFARINFPRDEYGDAPTIEKRPRRNNTLGYTGIAHETKHGYWIAKIKHQGKDRHIGVYATAEEAARAYDKVARELHGDRARLNFPSGT